MICILLSMVLLGQEPVDVLKKEMPDQINSIAFTYQVEEFCFSAAEEKYRKLVLEKFAPFGSTNWKERDQFSKSWLQLIKDNPNEGRWLFWGRHCQDQETKLRCNNLIRQTNKCYNCAGKGYYGDTYHIVCNACDGQGHVWGLSPWD